MSDSFSFPSRFFSFLSLFFFSSSFIACVSVFFCDFSFSCHSLFPSDTPSLCTRYIHTHIHTLPAYRALYISPRLSASLSLARFSLAQSHARSASCFRRWLRVACRRRCCSAWIMSAFTRPTCALRWRFSGGWAWSIVSPSINPLEGTLHCLCALGTTLALP